MKPIIRTLPARYEMHASYTTACILDVKTTCTAHCGGDASHGARAILALTDEGNTAWTLRVKHESGEETVIDCPRTVELTVAGDCEQSVLLAALEQMVATMRAAGVRPIDADEVSRTQSFALSREAH